jgi:hypothetical protein
MRASSSLARRAPAASAAALAGSLLSLLLSLLAPCGARAFAPAAPTALDERPCVGVTAALVRCVAEAGHDVLAVDDCEEWTQQALRRGAEEDGLAACADAALSASADADVLRTLVRAVHWLRASTPDEEEDLDAFAKRLLTTQPHRQRATLRATLAFVDKLPGARDNEALQDVLDEMAEEEEEEAEEYDAALR